MRPEKMMQRSNVARRTAIMETWVRLLGSLRLDASCLDDRPPLLDFGVLQGGERLRRLLLARRKLKPKIGEAGTHKRIGHRIHSSGIELGDDIIRGALIGAQSPSHTVT
jgi:hypothetical protein